MAAPFGGRTRREQDHRHWASGWSLSAAVIMITGGIFSALDGLLIRGLRSSGPDRA